jgi:hypothetical protein
MKFRKKKQEQEKDKEKYELSLLSKVLLVVAFGASIILVQIPLASGFLWAFLCLSTSFDIYRQQEERERREK